LQACKEQWFNNKNFQEDLLNRTPKEDKKMYVNLNTKERQKKNRGNVPWFTEL
jgi:hypothetical protein